MESNTFTTIPSTTDSGTLPNIAEFAFSSSADSASSPAPFFLAMTTTPETAVSTTRPASWDFLPTQNATMLALNLVELLGHLFLDCPFSALNFWLILHTAILHPNLKFILLCQSSCIFVRGIGRMSLNVLRLLNGEMTTSGPRTLVIIYSLPLFMRNYLAHVLVIERTAATIWARTYEHSKKPYFSLCWFAIVIMLTLPHVLVNDSLTRLTLILVTEVLAMVEIFLFSWIWKHNDGIYNKIFFRMHSLTERYQLSENIRTAKQLIPTLGLYLINTSIDCAFMSASYFRLLGPYNGSTVFNYHLSLQLAYTVATAINFAIELSMLICHPFLKRDFVRLWYRLFSKLWGDNRQIHPDSSTTSEPGNNRRSAGLATRNMRGERLVLKQEEEASGHFNHLNTLWEAMDRQRRGKMSEVRTRSL